MTPEDAQAKVRAVADRYRRGGVMASVVSGEEMMAVYVALADIIAEREASSESLREAWKASVDAEAKS